MKSWIKELLSLIIWICIFSIIIKVGGINSLLIVGFTVTFFSLSRIESKIDKLLKNNQSTKDLDNYIDNLDTE